MSSASTSTKAPNANQTKTDTLHKLKMNAFLRIKENLTRAAIAKAAAWIAVCIIVPTFQGCVPSYKFNGSALNYDVYKTIDITEFPIRAALVYPPCSRLSRTNFSTPSPGRPGFRKSTATPTWR